MNSNESSSGGTHSISCLIQQLKDDDRAAADKIWRRYFERLLPLARAKLKALPHAAVDEEDILVSVFDRFFRAAQEDRFAQLNDRDDLWQILLMLTERKVADQYRRTQAEKRGGKLAKEGMPPKLDEAQIREVAEHEPGPEIIAAFNDHLARAISQLKDEKTREVALLRLEGYTHREIGTKVDISLTSVERKLRVVREIWEQEF